MPEDTARALGVPDGTISIAGKDCAIRPLTVRELLEIESYCLKTYRRKYMAAFVENMDLLPLSNPELLLAEHRRVSSWSIDDIPPKDAFDPARIILTPELKAWLIGYWGLSEDESDTLRLVRLAAAALDQDALTEGQYKKLTGVNPPKVKISYVDWWTTGDYDGMITMLWMAFKHNDVTKEQVLDEFGRSLTRINELAREIDRLSAPQLKNG